MGYSILKLINIIGFGLVQTSKLNLLIVVIEKFRTDGSLRRSLTFSVFNEFCVRYFCPSRYQERVSSSKLYTFSEKSLYFFLPWIMTSLTLSLRVRKILLKNQILDRIIIGSFSQYCFLRKEKEYYCSTSLYMVYLLKLNWPMNTQSRGIEKVY